VWTAEHDGTHLAALFNWDDQPIHIPVPGDFTRATDMWTGEPVDTAEPIPPRSVLLLRV
jgi:hypothetical protein